MAGIRGYAGYGIVDGIDDKINEQIEKAKREAKKKEELEELERKKQLIKPYVLTKDEKNRIKELVRLMGKCTSQLDFSRTHYLLEEFIYLKLKPTLIGSSLLIDANITDYKIVVDKYPEARNFINCNIGIYFIKNEDSFVLPYSTNQITVDLKELFQNCSSVVISRLILTSTQIIVNKEFVDSFFKILEEVCDILGYSCILYTSSKQETHKLTNHYLEENWKKVVSSKKEK